MAMRCSAAIALRRRVHLLCAALDTQRVHFHEHLRCTNTSTAIRRTICTTVAGVNGIIVKLPSMRRCSAVGSAPPCADGDGAVDIMRATRGTTQPLPRVSSVDIKDTNMVHQAPVPRSVAAMPAAYTSFHDTLPLYRFRERYHALKSGEKLADEVVRVGGRVIGVRHMGRILFITIRGDAGTKLQLVQQVGEGCSKTELKATCEHLRVGDIVGAVGYPYCTLRGELSLHVSQLLLLVPYTCSDLTVCPDLNGYVALSDSEVRYRYRFVDMMTNPATVERFRRRHTIVKALRDFLDSRGFVEVETPILHPVASGASARPFATYHNANDTDLYLRIAPELYLKQCVVGGMERVYELGRVFRNEDADRRHNPEFTSCEFYAAFQTYEDLMPLTESIFRHLATAVNGTTKLVVASCVTGEPTEIDLGEPFCRINAYDEVQRRSGVELPPPSELDSARGRAYMAAIMLRHHITLPGVRTAAKMFDRLIEHFITDKVVAPTFVTHHPIFMSPLAKESDSRRGLSERFELFVNGTEYCNAYSELNDPQEQLRRFQRQLMDRRVGDDEAMQLDETFLKALQVGLPPTAGWGLGVDRVVSLLNGSASIRDDIIFPLLRHDIDSHDSKRRRRTASYFGFSHHMTIFCLNALEEEMRRRGAPAEICERVRQLRRCILTMGMSHSFERWQTTPHADSLHDRLPGFGLLPRLLTAHIDPTLAILRFICGSRN